MVDLEGLEAKVLTGLSQGEVFCLRKEVGLIEDDEEAVSSPG
jgi:hypothetical protein